MISAGHERGDAARDVRTRRPIRTGRWQRRAAAVTVTRWASWYAQWLIDLSELPDLLGVRPVRSELIYLLVSLDKQFTAEAPGEPWETYYARQILRHFRPSGS